MKRSVTAQPRTVQRAIELTLKQIRRLEANGAKRELLDEEYRRLKMLKNNLPWVRSR